MIQEKIRQLPSPARAWFESPTIRHVLVSDELLLESTPEEILDLFNEGMQGMRRAFEERPELLDMFIEPIREELAKDAERRRGLSDRGPKQLSK